MRKISRRKKIFRCVFENECWTFGLGLQFDHLFLLNKLRRYKTGGRRCNAVRWCGKFFIILGINRRCNWKVFVIMTIICNLDRYCYTLTKALNRSAVRVSPQLLSPFFFFFSSLSSFNYLHSMSLAGTWWRENFYIQPFLLFLFVIHAKRRS